MCRKPKFKSEIKKIARRSKKVKNEVMFSSNSEEWATPQKFFDELNKEFNFELDVCATPQNAKCKRFYTKNNDSLKHEWKGRCFMNPPYGRAIRRWIEKAVDSVRGGGDDCCMPPACKNGYELVA